MLKKYKKGFTLIELLVVIAIIAILASVVLVSLSVARAKGRDAKRVSDLKQIQNALELYYSDYGKYPRIFSGQAPAGNCSAITASDHDYPLVGNGNSTWLPPKYISKIPTDPSWNGIPGYNSSPSPNFPYTYIFCQEYITSPSGWNQ